MLNTLRDYSNPSSIGSKFRKKRFKHIENLVEKVLKSKNKCNILDIGGSAQYWNLMNAKLLKKCVVTVLNIEKPRGVDPREQVPLNGIFKFECGDGRNLNSIKDKQYDIAHSNSVIEHVGKIYDMQRFTDELTRVGKYYYLQTPNFWFPIEPHYGVPFIHWLPVLIRARLLAKWNIGFNKKFPTLLAGYDYAEFINLIDQNTLKSMLPAANFRKEKILFFTKSIIAIGPHEETKNAT